MRYTQPQSGPVQIDRNNPITRGLRDWQTPADRSSLVAASNPAIVTGKSGLGFKGDGSSSYWRSAGTKSINAAAEHTIFALVQGTTGADSRVYALADASSTIIQIGAGNSDGTKLRLWERSPGADIGAASTTATVFEAARPHAAVLRYRTGVLESFVDGVADATSAGTTSGSAVLAQVGIGALVRASSPASNSAATLFLGLFWDRALSNAEIASISANPWQVFKSPQRVMLVAAGGGTSYSYTSSGGFTLSGTASTVRGAVKTASGGVTLSGAATQSRGVVRSTTGGIQLAGSASVAKGRAITASGGLAISGTATILRGVTRSAAGGLQLAGTASATFFSAVQSRVVNPVGGIIFGGTAAVVRTCTRLVSGGITFGGTSPVEFFSILSTGASDWIGYIRRRGRR